MISTDRPIEESKDGQILGDPRFILVRADEVEDRPWMSESPICPLKKSITLPTREYSGPAIRLRLFDLTSQALTRWLVLADKEACWSMEFGSRWGLGKPVFCRLLFRMPFAAVKTLVGNSVRFASWSRTRKNQTFPRTSQCCRLMTTLP